MALEAGVEQRLVDQAGLDHAVGRAQQQDRRPPAPVAAGDLADQQGAPAVHRDQERQAREDPDAQVAQQILADERGEHQQAGDGTESTHAFSAAPRRPPALAAKVDGRRCS
ncbi:hypothetical protein GCM10020218_034660 [Dactylosporangium vinaceum]